MHENITLGGVYIDNTAYMLYCLLMPISGKKVLKLLLKDGWIKVSQSGSHVKLKKGKNITIIPVHGNKDIPNGTLRAIEKQTGVKLK